MPPVGVVFSPPTPTPRRKHSLLCSGSLLMKIMLFSHFYIFLFLSHTKQKKSIIYRLSRFNTAPSGPLRAPQVHQSCEPPAVVDHLSSGIHLYLLLLSTFLVLMQLKRRKTILDKMLKKSNERLGQLGVTNRRAVLLPMGHHADGAARSERK